MLLPGLRKLPADTSTIESPLPVALRFPAWVRLPDSVRANKVPALLVPSEAVIRTGTRTLVMLATGNGRFRPAEVRSGVEANGKTEILAGLTAGEKVVASGQFLIDSEASLAGVEARPVGAPQPETGKSAAQVYDTTGRIEAIAPDSITLSHQPVPALGWPAMTMTFRVVQPSLVRGYRKGEQVRFGFDQPPEGPTLRRLAREDGR